MDKYSLIGILSVISIIPILLTFVYLTEHQEPVIEKSITSCINDHIGGLSASANNPVAGYMFDIVVPNGDCKNNVILSLDNYTAMKNNVGFFTVLHKTPVNAVPTTGYCTLAQWIWNGHQGYYNVTKFKDLMIPSWCDSELKPVPIPEFGSMAMMIIILSFTAILVILKPIKIR